MYCTALMLSSLATLPDGFGMIDANSMMYVLCCVSTALIISTL